MPIVHVPEKGTRQKINSCKTRPPYGSSESGNYINNFDRWASREDLGTIWECPDCGNYLVTVKRGNFRLWSNIKWYHFTAQRVINDLKRVGKDELCR